jgi:hypothetical protein
MSVLAPTSRHPVGALADVGSLNGAAETAKTSRSIFKTTYNRFFYTCAEPGRQRVSTTCLRTLHVLADTDGGQRLTSCLTNSSAQQQKHHRRNVR